MAFNFRHAFGPGQITGVAIVPGEYFVVDELRNFSISSHFDKVAIRRLGHRLPVGWATGSGTIAGTLIFAQLTRGSFWRLRRYAGTVRVAQGRSLQTPQQERANITAMQSGIRPEQLPPFELMFVHASESGQMAISRLYDVTITDTGSVKGQGNQFTEEQLQYKAKFHEQIRLHRSLTTDQMVDLANEIGVEKQRGFFNDPRESNALLDNLLNVSGIDTGDLGEYLVAETEEVEESDVPTAMEIADSGEVVFQEQPDDHSGSTETSQTLREAQQKNKHFTHLIRDTVVIERSGGTLSTETLPAYVELKDQEVYVSGSQIDDTDNHSPVAAAAPGEPVFIPAANYYQELLKNSEYGLTDLRFEPDLVTLRVGKQYVERAVRNPSQDRNELEGLSVDTTGMPPPGTYTSEAPFFRESYDVSIGGSTSLEARFAPPGGPDAGDSSAAGPSPTAFQLPGGTSLEYSGSTNTIDRTSQINVEPSVGSATQNGPQDWTYQASVSESGETVLSCQVDVELGGGDAVAVFTDRAGNTWEERKETPASGAVRFERFGAEAEAFVGYNAASGQTEILDLNVSFRSESARCSPESPDNRQPFLHEGTWRGRDVSIRVDRAGQISGTVAGLSVSGGPGSIELVGNGSGVRLEADTGGAEIYLETKDVSV